MEEEFFLIIVTIILLHKLYMSMEKGKKTDSLLRGLNVDLDKYENIDYPTNLRSVNEKNVGKNGSEKKKLKLKNKSIPLQYLEPAERAVLHTLSLDSNVARLIQYKNDFTKLSIQDVLVQWKNVNVDILRESISLIDEKQFSLIAFIKLVQKKGRMMYFGMTLVFIALLMYIFNIVN